MLRGIKTSNHKGDQIFIIHSFANSSKLVSIAFGGEKIIIALFRALTNYLVLALEMGNCGTRIGCKPVG
jgi:hypothetical protein